MKQLYRIILLLCFSLAVEVSAQQRVTFVEPKEDSSITGNPDRIMIIIDSNSDKLEMSHTSGAGKGVKTVNEDGTYRYTINDVFPEDYYDDGFIKTTLELTLSGIQKNIELVVWRGKVYVGKCDENLISIERNADRVLPKPKAARVTFLSEIKRMDIECNGQVCFANGEAVPMTDINMTTSVKRDNGTLNEYIIDFVLDEEQKTPTFIKHPDFKITVGNSIVMDVDFEGELASRKSYSYTVVSNVKVVEKELSFEELLAKAQSSEKEADFFAAASAYQDARSHQNCPADRKAELEAHLGRVNSARRFLHYAEKFESQGAEVERKEGFTGDSVFIYYRGAIRSYKKVLEYAPGATVYAQREEALETKLKDHPMNNKVTTVAVKYQEITGTHPNGGGIPIYASYTPDKPKASSDDKPLGTTRGDGTFRLVFKTTPPPYLYFFGDKKSYAIDSTTTEINF